ncbi:hypothetical protein D9757_006526 [Collybiopsis confluens]|uniref:Nudix hydrolase domain-containing protein n=1 Tax=Collybiopsis confluens TaxID=2823264 RepID=A0A8H5MB98_9AGAR|nr:hypothetical protein D9757_006526 [Collybiopsis confluens]
MYDVASTGYEVNSTRGVFFFLKKRKQMHKMHGGLIPLRLPRFPPLAYCYPLPLHSHVHVRSIYGKYRKYSMSASRSMPTATSNVQQSQIKAKTTGTTQPVIPRPSASLVIVNERNEVLLVQRNPHASAFGGVTVFPGGNYDKKQDSSLRITAIRETFEESGLLIASPSSSTSRLPPDRILDEARFAVHEQKRTFQNFLDEYCLKADTDALLPFTAWITPAGPPKRFHTQFFVTFLPGASASKFTTGSKQERLPKPDGGQEVINARFVRPSDAISEFNARKITMMPPQFYILHSLAGILKSSRNTVDERSAVQALSLGSFGKMTINPVRLYEPGADGETILTYEGDETRGGSPGRLHRASVKMDKGGITAAIVFQRNFDIFTEIEPRAFEASTKL